MVAVGGQLGEDGFAAAVTQQVVVLVEPERGAEDRIVANEPNEARFDEVIELLVEPSGRRRRSGARERRHRSLVGHLGGNLRRAGDRRGVSAWTDG